MEGSCDLVLPKGLDFCSLRQWFLLSRMNKRGTCQKAPSGRALGGLGARDGYYPAQYCSLQEVFGSLGQAPSAVAERTGESGDKSEVLGLGQLSRNTQG